MGFTIIPLSTGSDRVVSYRDWWSYWQNTGTWWMLVILILGTPLSLVLPGVDTKMWVVRTFLQWNLAIPAFHGNMGTGSGCTAELWSRCNSGERQWRQCAGRGRRQTTQTYPQWAAGRKRSGGVRDIMNLCYCVLLRVYQSRGSLHEQCQGSAEVCMAGGIPSGSGDVW